MRHPHAPSAHTCSRPGIWSGHSPARTRIRRRRNEAEYDDIVIGGADLTGDLTHAEAITEAVLRAL